MMAMEVALFASLRKYRPDRAGSFSIDVPEGSTVDALLEIVGIPTAETKQTFVNSLREKGEYVLRDKDRVAIFPPIAGG